MNDQSKRIKELEDALTYLHTVHVASNASFRHSPLDQAVDHVFHKLIVGNDVDE